LLGPLEVSDDTGPVAIGKPRQRAVLARLLLDVNHVVPIERIVSDVRGEMPPARPVGAVHAYVSTLRCILEPDRAPRASATVLMSRSPASLLLQRS
jgi:DNA-binding SARP family transcriptional activator